jgi:hypothetical protein
VSSFRDPPKAGWRGAPVRLLIDIAVNDFGGKSALPERLLHRLREHYGAVLPAGAAERNGSDNFFPR